MIVWKAVMTLRKNETVTAISTAVIRMTELNEQFYWRLPNVKQKLNSPITNPTRVKSKNTYLIRVQSSPRLLKSSIDEADSENLATASDPIDNQKACYCTCCKGWLNR
jgi:hypothetical protein